MLLLTTASASPPRFIHLDASDASPPTRAHGSISSVMDSASLRRVNTSHAALGYLVRAFGGGTARRVGVHGC